MLDEYIKSAKLIKKKTGKNENIRYVNEYKRTRH